jgi:hypothetical protein
MGREKKSGPGPAPGSHAKEKHRRAGRGLDWSGPAPRGLIAKPELPIIKSKHHSYFEFVENKDKKKKLEFKVMVLSVGSDAVQLSHASRSRRI